MRQGYFLFSNRGLSTVREKERVTVPKASTPQGGVVSPVLANVYLHDVVDEWVEQEVKPHLQGQVFLLRDRDDVVMGVTRETDAQQVREALSMRVSQYGLALHPGKTRMIPFHGPAQHAAEQGGGAATRPGTFEWLGFYPLLGTISERELGGEAPDAPPD